MESTVYFPGVFDGCFRLCLMAIRAILSLQTADYDRNPSADDSCHIIGRVGSVIDQEPVMAMMTSRHGNVFRITGHFWGEPQVTGRWSVI